MADARTPVLVGPTGVGKTAVALALAALWPIEVISADMQSKPDLAVQLAQQWYDVEGVDVIVTPTGAANQLTATNLTGHPACILPNGFRDGTPINVSITFLGSLFGEANLLRVAHAYQQATGFHLRHPALA